MGCVNFLTNFKAARLLKILFILYNILFINNLKTVQSSNYYILQRIDSFLTKNTLLEKIPNNLGRGLFPFSGDAQKKKTFFTGEVPLTALFLPGPQNDIYNIYNNHTRLFAFQVLSCNKASLKVVPLIKM